MTTATVTQEAALNLSGGEASSSGDGVGGGGGSRSDAAASVSEAAAAAAAFKSYSIDAILGLRGGPNSNSGLTT